MFIVQEQNKPIFLIPISLQYDGVNLFQISNVYRYLVEKKKEKRCFLAKTHFHCNLNMIFRLVGKLWAIARFDLQKLLIFLDF